MAYRLTIEMSNTSRSLATDAQRFVVSLSNHRPPPPVGEGGRAASTARDAPVIRRAGGNLVARPDHSRGVNPLPQGASPMPPREGAFRTLGESPPPTVTFARCAVGADPLTLFPNNPSDRRNTRPAESGPPKEKWR